MNAYFTRNDCSSCWRRDPANEEGQCSIYPNKWDKIINNISQLNSIVHEFCVVPLLVLLQPQSITEALHWHSVSIQLNSIQNTLFVPQRPIQGEQPCRQSTQRQFNHKQGNTNMTCVWLALTGTELCLWVLFLLHTATCWWLYVHAPKHLHD